MFSAERPNPQSQTSTTKRPKETTPKYRFVSRKVEPGPAKIDARGNFYILLAESANNADALNKVHDFCATVSNVDAWKTQKIQPGVLTRSVIPLCTERGKEKYLLTCSAPLTALKALAALDCVISIELATAIFAAATSGSAADPAVVSAHSVLRRSKRKGSDLAGETSKTTRTESSAAPSQ